MRGNFWTFNRPTKDKIIRFEPNGETWHALDEARKWLSDNGYKYGSLDGHSFVPCVKGDEYNLPQKLHNFDLEDYKQVNAVICSNDYREGWCEVWLVEYTNVLVLSLKKQWYEMIRDGIKKEEYREDKKYWCRRFLGFDHVLFSYRNGYSSCNRKDYTHVEFTLGYPKWNDKSRRMLFKIEDIVYGKGKPEWGAPEQPVFIIKLGERIR